MRILVLHAWMKGNLGDVLQLSVLLSALRDLQPRTLALAGYPADAAPETAEVLRLADRYLPDPFPRYWTFMPRAVARAVVEPAWRRRRRALFAHYDAIVCAPGPYLAAYDPRAVSALCDIDVAARMGLPVVLASHSIGPLGGAAIEAVRRAAAIVAREPATHEYLRERGVASVASADLAFLYPYPRGGELPVAPPYRLLFLRSNNLRLDRLRLERGALFDGSRRIAEAGDEPFVLATSDRRRDERFLARASRALGVRAVVCRSVAELSRLIEASSGVVSDRYHPAICAAVLGRPARVLPNREPHKMQGLQDLLGAGRVDELQTRARAGLEAVRSVLRESL